MIFLSYNPIETGRACVMAIVYKHEALFDEMKINGLYVESLPNPDPATPGTPVLYVNPDTKALWYEYLPPAIQPLYADTEAGRLQQQVDDLKLLIAELITGGTAS